MIDILVMIYHYFRASSENLLKNKTLYGIMVVMALVLGCKALKGENLLINGDFETGIAPGWEPSFVQGVTVKIDTLVHYSGGSSLGQMVSCCCGGKGFKLFRSYRNRRPLFRCARP